MTEYRKEMYDYLKKFFKVKFVSFIDNDEERLLLNKKSKISIYIKKEKTSLYTLSLDILMLYKIIFLHCLNQMTIVFLNILTL